MERREALKRVIFIMGSTVISSELFINGCQSEDRTQTEKIKTSFSQSDIVLLDEIAETIIPVTDTLGAKAAGVGSFIAAMVPEFYEEIDQKNFKEGLYKFNKDFKSEFGDPFVNGNSEDRIKALYRMEKEIITYQESKKEKDPAHFYNILKELTLLGYFTSEIGSTEARKYNPVPGRYEGCIPYNPGDKAWAV